MRSQAAPARVGLSIVTVTYNSAKVLGGFLDSIGPGVEGLDDVEVVVVDNASQDGSVALAQAHPLDARVIESGRNGGYAAGINLAEAAIAADRALLILNPDIRLARGSAAALLARLRDDPTIGVAVPIMAQEDGRLYCSLRREPSLATAWTDGLLGGTLAMKLGRSETIGPDDPLYQIGGSVDWATGAALAVAPKARATVGGWDETFFLYSEEVDYMRRIRNAGFRVECVPAARVVHIGGEREDNPRLFSLMTTNRILDFSRQHTPLATALFRAAVILGEGLRVSRGAGHWVAFRAALGLQPSSEASN